MDLYNVYSLYNIAIDKGKGCTVWDEEGQEYLDMYGGHAVISVGHCHPHYVDAVTRQLRTIGFYSNAVVNRLQQALAYHLGRASGYDDYSLFLVNSGAEANENALKLASFYNGRRRVLAAEKAFHGRTALALAATDNAALHAPITASTHVSHLPLNDVAPWQREIEKGDVCAVILESIQGVGGIRLVDTAFAQALRRLCDATGTVLIMDEIQCGYGRSGSFFAHDHLGIRADIITVAKGICNGIPMGGVIIGPQFTPVKGQLGTTFGGNHLACAGAIAVLEIIEKEHLVDNARVVGAHLLERLRQAALPHVVDIRGRGLMIGIELDIPHRAPRERLLRQEHCFTGCAAENIIRLLPPLCLTLADADDFVERIKRVLV